MGANMKNEKRIPKCINDVFEIVKENMGCETVAELITELDVSEGYYHKLKRGAQHLSAEKALKIASKAGLTQESMLVLLAREKAATDEERAIWDKIIRRECRIMDSTVHNVG